MIQDTSLMAARDIRPHRSKMLTELMNLFDQHQSPDFKGFTCYDVEVLTGWKHQTASARMADLKKLGVIEKVERRPLSVGRPLGWAWRIKGPMTDCVMPEVCPGCGMKRSHDGKLCQECKEIRRDERGMSA